MSIMEPKDLLPRSQDPTYTPVPILISHLITIHFNIIPPMECTVFWHVTPRSSAEGYLRYLYVQGRGVIKSYRQSEADGTQN